jgi:hypothetical protein
MLIQIPLVFLGPLCMLQPLILYSYTNKLVWIRMYLSLCYRLDMVFKYLGAAFELMFGCLIHSELEKRGRNDLCFNLLSLRACVPFSAVSLISSP